MRDIWETSLNCNWTVCKNITRRQTKDSTSLRLKRLTGLKVVKQTRKIRFMISRITQNGLVIVTVFLSTVKKETYMIQTLMISKIQNLWRPK